jgi:hypothetical protein
VTSAQGARRDGAWKATARLKSLRLERPAGGVYEATHTIAGAVIGNAGITDLGGRMLVDERFIALQAGEDLRIAG